MVTPYTGREWDKETGVYYYRARYYDPMDGRYISKEPVGFKDGISIYSYTKNNPINHADPSGLTGASGSWSNGSGWGGTEQQNLVCSDDLDAACQQHDACYATNGFDWKTVVKPQTESDLCNIENKCDKELRDAAIRFTPTNDKRRARDMILRIF